MDEQTFIRTVAQRVGPANAIQQLNPVQQGALIELLVEKGIITHAELHTKTLAGFEKVARMIMTMPVPSPIKV